MLTPVKVNKSAKAYILIFALLAVVAAISVKAIINKNGQHETWTAISKYYTWELLG